MKREIRVERLSNGLVSVYDSHCQWHAIYNPDGSYRHSGVDCREYRAAVAAFIAESK